MAKQESDENFTDDYEECIERLLGQTSLLKGTVGSANDIAVVKKLLYDKREFGIKKYGDISFQSSLENAMKVDTLQHAREELIDYMNYTLHDIYKSSVKGELDRVKDHIKRFRIAFSLYSYTR